MFLLKWLQEFPDDKSDYKNQLKMLDKYLKTSKGRALI